MKTMTDEELMHSYREGDQRAFEVIEERYRNELFSYLRRYLGDAEAAKDVRQLTFLRVHVKCDSFDVSMKFRSWLFTIATNAAIDWQRRKKNRTMVSLDAVRVESAEKYLTLKDMLITPAMPPDMNMRREERRLAVHAAVEQLSPRLSEAVRLIYFERMKYREAAETIGIHLGTLKSRLYTGVTELEEGLSDWKDLF